MNVLEGMACGKPAIGVHTRGLWDYILDGKTGFLIDFHDTEKFVEKILYFLDNPKEIKRMGANARKLVVEKYSMEKRVSQVIKLYRKMIR